MFELKVLIELKQGKEKELDGEDVALVNVLAREEANIDVLAWSKEERSEPSSFDVRDEIFREFQLECLENSHQSKARLNICLRLKGKF